MVERPYADWLSVRFCSSSSAFAPPSSPKDTEGWLLEREKREKRMPPMPFPMLAAPTSSVEREKKKDYAKWGVVQNKTSRTAIMLYVQFLFLRIKNYFKV